MTYTVETPGDARKKLLVHCITTLWSGRSKKQTSHTPLQGSKGSVRDPKKGKTMASFNRYTVYDVDGRIIQANINKHDLAVLLGVSADTIRRHLLGVVCGQKERYKEYTIECVTDRAESKPNTATQKLLDAEWDEVCMPFRRLRLLSKH